MNEEKEEIRDLSWIFESLWILCGAGNDKIYHVKYQLNIPDTILFCDGIPSKWLSTGSTGKKYHFKFAHVMFYLFGIL